MTRRRFLVQMKRIFNDSREAVIAYLTEEIRFLQAHIAKRPKPTEGQKAALARAAKAVDPEHLERTFNLFQPSTLLRWYRELITRKWTYPVHNRRGRPRIDPEMEKLAIQLALDNGYDGYSGLVGRLKTLGYETNEQTIKNILKRNGIPPSRFRNQGMNWKDFLDAHRQLLSNA